MADQIGWCAPAYFEGVPDLPTFSVQRGGIDFNAPPRPPVYVATHCEHRWGRTSRALQCDCGQCHLDDPRGLDCMDCTTRLGLDDPDFDALYEAAPWWVDE